MSEAIATLSIAEGEKMLARYAKLAAANDALEAELAAKIAPLKAATDKKLQPLIAQMATIKEALQPWWGEHAAALTGGKKKSHELAGCVIGSRANPKRLVYQGKDEEEAIAKLREGRFNTLVDRVYQLNKKAILARVEAEPEGNVAQLGFTVLQGETFFVDPATRSRKA